MWHMKCWTICFILLLYHNGQGISNFMGECSSSLKWLWSAAHYHHDSKVQHNTIMSVMTFGLCVKKCVLKHVVLWWTLLIWMEFAISEIFSSGLWNAHLMFKSERETFWGKFCVLCDLSSYCIIGPFLYLIIHITVIITGQYCITSSCHSFLLLWCLHTQWFM